HTHRLGIPDTSPLPAASPTRFAGQVRSLSDQPSVDPFVEKLRSETGQRVDAIFDPASSFWAILAGDFPDSAAAEQFRGELTQRGYGKDMLIVRRATEQPFAKQHQIVDDEGDQATIGGPSLRARTRCATSASSAARATTFVPARPARPTSASAARRR